ncbi:hypothetical protein [Chryseobacterium polytrichastri]|uniref:Uncharacterized protein n=1 Tax=Chryseobacterium polytrichastri TaxID=1302687 RepID=A0A1M7FCL6_9FLAO|nr:hypothetical protein [Chryseobacterium polytrichastri]SHM01832.1 hypothetical protein SAMN05444267_103146 [Chryseobacterium polytrichastri]
MNKISIINSKDLKTLANEDKYIFVNFSYKHAVKISYFYEDINKNERNKLIQLFNQLTNIEIRVDDMLGKLNIILLKLIIDGKKNNIVVSNIGFHMKSFEFLIDNIKKIFENYIDLANKHVIIVECNLNNQEDNEHINTYFDL